jgi:hypothetical protein
MSKEIVQIMSLVACSEDEATAALAKYGDVVLAVDSLITLPATSGNKYIPPKPEINRMMTEEQKQRCDRGRQVCDTINASRKSAYHSAKQQADLAAEAQQELSVVQLEDAHYEQTS